MALGRFTCCSCSLLEVKTRLWPFDGCIAGAGDSTLLNRLGPKTACSESWASESPAPFQHLIEADPPQDAIAAKSFKDKVLKIEAGRHMSKRWRIGICSHFMKSLNVFPMPRVFIREMSGGGQQGLEAGSCSVVVACLCMDNTRSIATNTVVLGGECLLLLYT